MVMIEFDLFDLDKLLRSCPNGSTKDKIKKAREMYESGGIVFFNGSTSLDNEGDKNG
ncbi:hypothetical protein [Treponema pedis]|uniref:hypothetical protein n=1 Tax=Treponema pedis TaxID=409322 RepID=UPI003142D65D